MDFRLGIAIGATLLLGTAAPPDPSDVFCASFADTHEPCGCTISQIAAFDPVCGSDGLTYLNECYMACRNVIERSDVDVYVEHPGVCNEGCCKCKGIYDPYCGTDGNTYSNKCTLSCTQETENSNLGFEHAGVCGAGDKGRERRPSEDDARIPPRYKNPKRPTSTIKNKKPNRPLLTIKDPEHPLCVCSAIYIPVCAVCGNNQKSYINFCVLFCVTKSDPNLKFAHWGSCIKRNNNK